VKTIVIRCGTPDCDWVDQSQEQLELCYSEFRKHSRRDHRRRGSITTQRPKNHARIICSTSFLIAKRRLGEVLVFFLWIASLVVKSRG
jgi:hypothetical protein